MFLLMLASALFAVLSLPLAAGKIAPNRLYGLSTPRTRADDRVWFPVNRMAGRRGFLASAAVGVLAVIGWIGMLGGGTVLLASVLLGLGTLVSMLVSAAAITARVDRGGPRLDLSSSLKRGSASEVKRKRESLLDKLER